MAIMINTHLLQLYIINNKNYYINRSDRIKAFQRQIFKFVSGTKSWVGV